jgi:hypothetical protein
MPHVKNRCNCNFKNIVETNWYCIARPMQGLLRKYFSCQDCGQCLINGRAKHAVWICIKFHYLVVGVSILHWPLCRYCRWNMPVIEIIKKFCTKRSMKMKGNKIQGNNENEYDDNKLLLVTSFTNHRHV